MYIYISNVILNKTVTKLATSHYFGMMLFSMSEP